MKKSHLSILIVILLTACLDNFNLKVNGTTKLLVVNGMITNEPGPYSVKLFWSSNVGDILNQASPVVGASITLLDDLGLSEVLQDQGKGVYQTSANGIQGQIGRTYHLQIKTPDGQSYYSKPELLTSAGTIDSLFYQFNQSESIQSGVAVANNGFYMYVNSHSASAESLLRWNWTGTFEVVTHPELATIPNTGMPGLPSLLAAPLPCSGYISTDFVTIQKVDRCTCCQCWVDQYPNSPVLSNNQSGMSNNYQAFNVAYIPANPVYFFVKYYFELQQLSVTQNTYTFWKLIRSQQTGATSLFQPPIAKVVGNIEANSANNQALGVFSACGIVRKSMWLSRNDIPYNFPDVLLVDDCTKLDSTARTKQPSFWQ